MGEHYERHNANVARADAHARRRGDRGVRGRPGQGGRVHRRAARDEVVFTKNATEALNLVANTLGAAPTATRGPVGPATRSSSPRWSTTPTSCRGSCCAERTGATLRWFGVTDDGRLDLSHIDELITERTKVVSLRARVEHARHDQPGRRDRRARPRRSARWSWSTRSQAVPQMPVDVADARRRLPAPSPATRCSARPASACCGAGASCSSAAAVPRRRRDDRDRHDGAARRTPRRRTGSRPAPRRSPRRSGSARRSTT